METRHETSDWYFWGRVIVTLGLFYLAARNLYDLIIIINAHTEGADTQASVLGKSFGLTLLFGFLAYKASKWFGPTLAANSSTGEKQREQGDEVHQRGDLAQYSEWQWRRLLPEALDIVSGGHDLYNECYRSLNIAIREFLAGGSSSYVQAALNKAGKAIEKFEQIVAEKIEYAKDLKELRTIYSQINNVLPLVTGQAKSPNEKRLQILAASDDDIAEYSVSHIEGDESPDPISVENRLMDDPRIFNGDYTTGRQYTTGGYSDDHPEVSSYSFQCLKVDLADLKELIASLSKPTDT